MRLWLQPDTGALGTFLGVLVFHPLSSNKWHFNLDLRFCEFLTQGTFGQEEGVRHFKSVGEKTQNTLYNMHSVDTARGRHEHDISEFARGAHWAIFFVFREETSERNNVFMMLTSQKNTKKMDLSFCNIWTTATRFDNLRKMRNCYDKD